MNPIKNALAKAVIRILTPLIRLLLKYEISHREFTELAKRAYVNVAFRDFSLPNRKNTYSRVAVLTGLSRKEVVRLTTSDEEEALPQTGPLNRATRVISGWLRDPDFVDENGNPKSLPLRGECGSFAELVARYSGDITARTILDELIRVGAVSRLADKRVVLNHYGYIPEDSEPEKIDVLAKHVSDLLNTTVHNINCPNRRDTRFQRQVTYSDIPESVVDEFRQLSHEKSLALLLELNQWLANQKQTIKARPGEPNGRVGVGIYYFENENEGD